MLMLFLIIIAMKLVYGSHGFMPLENLVAYLTSFGHIRFKDLGSLEPKLNLLKMFLVINVMILV